MKKMTIFKLYDFSFYLCRDREKISTCFLYDRIAFLLFIPIFYYLSELNSFDQVMSALALNDTCELISCKLLVAVSLIS